MRKKKRKEQEESPSEEVTGVDEAKMLVLQFALSTQKSEKNEQRQSFFTPNVLYKAKFAL